MFITVVIPYYKAKKYFKECLESVINQTFEGLEVIIVIDGPHDKTELPYDCIKRCDDPRIKVIEHTENKGLAAARNTGIVAANGEWIICLDADDLLPINILQLYDNLIQSKTNYCFFYGNSYLFGSEKGINYFLPFNVYDLLKLKCPGGAGVLIHRSVFENVLYDESAILRQGNEDYEFWINVLKHKYVGCYLPETTYLYRKNINTMVSKLMGSTYETTNYISTKHQEFLKQFDLDQTIKSKGYSIAANYYLSKGNFKEAARLCKIALSINAENAQAITIVSKCKKARLKRILGVR